MIAYLALTAFVVLFHVFAFVIESILITSDVGVKLFGDLAVHCAVLAQNQGVYNLCLAFGNLWALVASILSMKETSSTNVAEVFRLRIFFAVFVVIVGATNCPVVVRLVARA